MKTKLGFIDVDKDENLVGLSGAAVDHKGEAEAWLRRRREAGSKKVVDNTATSDYTPPQFKQDIGNTNPQQQGRNVMTKTTETTETKTTEAKPEKTPRVELPKANGVTRPSSGTKTGRVWEVADEISAARGEPAPRKDVMEKCKAEGINEATIATQYGKWRKFHGLKAERKAPEAKPAAEAPAAADVKVE